MNKYCSQLLLFFAVTVAFAACTSSCSPAGKITKEDKTTVKQDSNVSLPPGNANVTVQINEIADEGKNLAAAVKIEEVFGYGPSTPPLPPGSEIKIYLLKSLIKDQENKPAEGEKLSMRIAFERGANDINKWIFKFFIKKND